MSITTGNHGFEGRMVTGISRGDANYRPGGPQADNDTHIDLGCMR